ncbi:hypothetical protein SCUCBS95973_006065 [Sporothrix curviconia]|uniref:Uncharacterized protein n=1 Tax=Sporothrix curviconia TaxID=1260050 RepID=A0ABP0C213_9PEZI
MSSSANNTSPMLPLHIPAPFDLRNHMDDIGNDDNKAFFHATFPGNTGYAHDGLFLYIFLEPAPTPKPKSFAGVPIVFMRSEFIAGSIPPPPPFAAPIGFIVLPQRVKIASHLNYNRRRDLSCDPLFEAIRDYFAHSIRIPITEIIYWSDHLSIVLEHRDINRSVLPSVAGHVPCMYLFEDEMQRPATLLSETRQRDPIRDGVDTTEYDRLRPGVRIASTYIAGTDMYSTSTLGTRVTDAHGHEFITVAYHAFSDAGPDVFHPARDTGRHIGWVADRVGKTDVGLMKLAPTENFSNEVFLSDLYDDDDRSPQISGLAAGSQFDIVTLDSPYSGVVYGQAMGISEQRIPSDSNNDPHAWIKVDYIFMGKDNEEELPASD